MAPYPEEIDVFSAPHSRMKALVDVYSEKLTCTDFKDYMALESLLQELHHTFCEFKSHEQIENRYIMRKLKKRLKLLSIQDAAVCNCHSDNKLQEMLALVEDGYSCTSKAEEERMSFGRRLQRALQDFTTSFLPHMKEEEEVFQPMLMKYFEYEELKCLKERVIREHSKWHAYEKNTLEDAQADHKVDNAEVRSGAPSLNVLPPEVLQHVLTFLSPRDLLRTSSVCRQWYSISKAPALWRKIHPCAWAHDIWEDYSECHEDRVSLFYPDSNPSPTFLRDEDADVASEGEEDDEEMNGHQREALFLGGVVRYLLPQVGQGVQKIVLGSSRGLTSGMLRSILMLCPNVTYLDVSYTPILDSAFKGLSERQSCFRLRHLNLSGCKNVTDEGLFRLADAMAMPIMEGVRDVYMEDCGRFEDQRWGQEEDCLCEIEESGFWLRKRRVCRQCCANDFCDSVCMWQKDGLLCHLAKLSLQCPFVSELPSPSTILKTEATLLTGSPPSGSLSHLNLSGCKEVTDDGLRCLFEARVLRELEFLDVSGCWLLSGQELCSITDTLPLLKPENIFYCDQIQDGPYPQTANGCQNLENGLRACCRLNSS